mmetsp:Transcript_9505/g.14157  ORF Transcript_9505/g.14157 Transcript_9505/m.14157 type:complete len:219 (-) Transcript_9505:31-687(-)
MFRRFSSFRLPGLPFKDTALEPYYDKTTLSFHHGKHHQTYVNNLNAALGDQSPSLLECIQERAQHSEPVRKNGGGHYNHCLYWLGMGEQTSEKPSGKLLEYINKEWGDFSKFQEEMSKCATGVFGSGWAWLTMTPEGRLQILGSSNQDNPLMRGIFKANSIPFFTIDVWEHAYYLQYQNRRPEYLDQFWKVVNWKQVEEMFEQYALNQKPVPADELLP